MQPVAACSLGYFAAACLVGLVAAENIPDMQQHSSYAARKLELFETAVLEVSLG